jgi:hypothetical protein
MSVFSSLVVRFKGWGAMVLVLMGKRELNRIDVLARLAKVG